MASGKRKTAAKATKGRKQAKTKSTETPKDPPSEQDSEKDSEESQEENSGEEPGKEKGGDHRKSDPTENFDESGEDSEPDPDHSAQKFTKLNEAYTAFDPEIHSVPLPGPTGSGKRKYDHFPVLEYPQNPAWWNRPVDQIRADIPNNCRLDDCMLIAVTKMFSPHVRRMSWPADFDTGGDARTSRLHVGPPPIVRYQTIDYFLIYKRYYVISGEEELSKQQKPEIGRQRDARRAGNKDKSVLSFGACVVPVHLPIQTPMRYERTHTTYIESARAPRDRQSPPPSVPLAWWIYDRERDFFYPF